MAWVRSLLFNICFLSTTLFLALLTFPAAAFCGDGSIRWLYGVWARSVMWLIRYVLGASIEVRGQENLSDDAPPALIVSKHQSELDVILMAMLYPGYGAIVMRELDNYPLLGRIIDKLGHIKVAVKGNRSNQLPEVLEGSSRVHAEGRPVLIYPEATLMEVGKKARYRSGVWYIYKELNVPATPVAHCLGLVWPQRKIRKFPAKAAVEFLPPIPPGLAKGEFLALLEERIETATNALIIEHATPEAMAQIEFDDAALNAAHGTAQGDAA